LLGIQQLKGLQQQSQLAEQQAAIAQQNAAFQQQMQPLQLEAERARIGQIGQATATSAEALRQGRLTFEQTQQDRVRGMEQQAVAQTKQNELFGRLTSFSADTPMSDILPVVNELALFKPESAKQILQGFEMAPKQIQKATETTLVSAANQLKAGDIEGARNTYSTFAAAIQNSMGKNPEVKAIADAANVQAKLLDPQTGQAGINIAKASALELLGVFNPQALTSIVGADFGGKQVDEEKRALDLEKERLQIDKIKQELQAGGKEKQVDEERRALDLQKERLQIRELEQKIDAGGKEKKVDEEKRALDLEKERLQIQEIKQKLDQAREEKVKVFASTNKFAKELSDASATNQQSADIAKGILEKIDSGEVQIPSTAKGAAWQYVRDRIPLLGNDVTMLRKEYQKLANSEVIKSLPPGSASDADRRFAQEGVMSKDANPKQFRKGVEAMARLSEYASRYNEAKLAWVSQNAGSAGSALKEFSVFGAPIKKGSAFNAWWNKEGNKLDQNFMPDQAGAGASLDALLNKYR
jgi:hypothetical protein